MLFTKSIAIAILATAGANAGAALAVQPSRPAAPQKPVTPIFNVQNIQCGSSAAPYCCSPSTSQASSGGLLDEGTESGGNTCSKMTGSVSCNAMVICCNNNGVNSEQTCSSSISQLKQPVVIV